MKKRFFALAVAIALTGLLVGCGAQTQSTPASSASQTSKAEGYAGAYNMTQLDVDAYGEYAQLELNDSKIGDLAWGTLEVADSPEIVIDSALEKGAVEVWIFDRSQGVMSNYPNPKDALRIVTLEGEGVHQCEMPLGKYFIAVMPVEESTGSVAITTGNRRAPESLGRDETFSPEAAAEASGVAPLEVADSLTVESVSPETIRYRSGEGYVYTSASFPMRSGVRLIMYKALPDVDVVFDPIEYAHAWTQQVGDIEVACKGNQEGAATVMSWKTEGASYTVLAYGHEAEHDYGLSPEDVAGVVSAIA